MRPFDHPLINAEAIAKRVRELAGAVSTDYAERDLVVLCVLKGAIHFTSDLLRGLTVPATLDFVRAKSYEGTASGPVVELLMKPSEPLAGRDVLIVEDILDTGRTTTALKEYLAHRDTASVAVCVLLDKPACRTVETHADYVGFIIEEEFVVGYGLDCNEQFRELPAIYKLVTDEEC